jgi:nucleoside-diphosphate-sugar epimerase
LAKGWELTALSRAQTGKGCANHWQRFDLNDAGSNALLENVDVLVHAAYDKGGAGRDAMSVNREGTFRLLRSAHQARVGRCIFISSFSAHESARSAYGRQKLEIERDVANYGGVAIRPGLVLGNGGLFANLTAQLRRRPFVPLIDGGMQPLQTVHIDDLVAAIDATIEKGIRGSLNVAEKNARPYRAFFETLSAHIGVECKFIPVNSRVALNVLRIANALGVPTPITVDNVLGACDLMWRDTRRDEEQLGIRFRSADQSIADLFPR